MSEWFNGLGEIIAAIGSGDSWQLSQALQHSAAWTMGLLVLIAAALMMATLYRRVPWLERNLERSVMVITYLSIGAIIFVEVFRRFVLSQQAPWSTTLPPFLFLIMTWFGCSYNVKLRTHLAFSEFRSRMPRAAQLACLMLDALLWMGFSWVVVVTSTRVVANSASNFQIMLGTDNIMQWWFLLSVPIAFILLTARVFENVSIDWQRYNNGDTLIEQGVIGGD
ncbi:TRAP transporter small permease subunit [Gammaproteobacteria bacterium]|nr:TRAP transporter small permease subunit [Gammaproteobacteria bacterium]